MIATNIPLQIAPTGVLDGYIDLHTAGFLFVVALAAGVAGALAGILTRNILAILGILTLIWLFFSFSYLLPLPTNTHIQIMDMKAQMRSWIP